MRIISVFICIAISITTILQNNVFADSDNKPSFDITVSIDPTQAEVGQDITVTGEIIP